MDSQNSRNLAILKKPGGFHSLEETGYRIIQRRHDTIVCKNPLEEFGSFAGRF